MKTLFKKRGIAVPFFTICFLFITIASSFSQDKIGDECGTWRWDIKTATDGYGTVEVFLGKTKEISDSVRCNNFILLLKKPLCV